MKPIILALTLMLVACGSGGGNGGAPGGYQSPCPNNRDTYPSGPYGLTKGDIIANVTFSEPGGGELSLAELRADTSAHLLHLSTAAGWCTACIEEQPRLVEWEDTYGPEGLAVVVSVFEDPNGFPVDASYAKQWAQAYETNFPVVADTPFVLSDYYPGGDISVTPLNLLIDLCTMEIIDLRVGADPTALEALIEANL